MRYEIKKLAELNIQVIDGDRGKNYPHKEELYAKGDCLFLSANNVTKDGFRFDELQFITKEKDEILRGGKLQRGDVVITTRGTVGNVGYYDDSVPYDNMRINSGMLIVRCGEGISSQYLYYVFKSDWFVNQMRSIQSGSAQPQLPKSHFLKMYIPYPMFIVQQQIVALLDCIDDKIELNNAINHNLEQQAQAIFKSYFVDFEPFGGTMPDGWTQGKLSDYVTVKRGGSPRPIQEFLSDDGYYWLKISDVTSLQTPFITNITEHIKASGLNKTVYLKKGSLVLSNSATPGIPKILDVDACIHDGWLYFPQSKFSNEFLYLLFEYIRPKLITLGNGSVFTNLKTDILKNYLINKPDDKILNEFNKLISPLFNAILYNTRQIKELSTLRNTLLPKLMSGEIDVSEVEI